MIQVIDLDLLLMFLQVYRFPFNAKSALMFTNFLLAAAPSRLTYSTCFQNNNGFYIVKYAQIHLV